MSDARRLLVSAGIQFGLLKSSDALRLSVVELNNPNLYQHGTRDVVEHGVLDHRLGTSVKVRARAAFVCFCGLCPSRWWHDAQTSSCTTCGHNVTNCSGHFGHVSLALPIFHAGYHKSMISILNQICKVRKRTRRDCGSVCVSVRLIGRALLQQCSRLLLTPEEVRDFRAKMRRVQTDQVRYAMNLSFFVFVWFVFQELMTGGCSSADATC